MVVQMRSKLIPLPAVFCKPRTATASNQTRSVVRTIHPGLKRSLNPPKLAGRQLHPLILLKEYTRNRANSRVQEIGTTEQMSAARDGKKRDIDGLGFNRRRRPCASLGGATFFFGFCSSLRTS